MVKIKQKLAKKEYFKVHFVFETTVIDVIMLCYA